MSEIESGIKIQFTKDDEEYEINVTKKSAGYTSMTDYYIFGDMLTYNEFIELEGMVNKTETAVSKWNFK